MLWRNGPVIKPWSQKKPWSVWLIAKRRILGFWGWVTGLAVQKVWTDPDDLYDVFLCKELILGGRDETAAI